MSAFSLVEPAEELGDVANRDFDDTSSFGPLCKAQPPPLAQDAVRRFCVQAGLKLDDAKVLLQALLTVGSGRGPDLDSERSVE